MKEHINNVLNFFYLEGGPVSAYNNRFVFGISENEFYRILDILEESKCIEAVGIRHSIHGYNLYRITQTGIIVFESGGFNDRNFSLPHTIN